MKATVQILNNNKLPAVCNSHNFSIKPGSPLDVTNKFFNRKEKSLKEERKLLIKSGADSFYINNLITRLHQ